MQLLVKFQQQPPLPLAEAKGWSQVCSVMPLLSSSAPPRLFPPAHRRDRALPGEGLALGSAHTNRTGRVFISSAFASFLPWRGGLLSALRLPDSTRCSLSWLLLALLSAAQAVCQGPLIRQTGTAGCSSNHLSIIYACIYVCLHLPCIFVCVCVCV